MKQIKDLTGMKFNRLTVIKRVQNDNTNHSCWLCKCICGKIKIVRGSALRTNKIQSCGCLQKEYFKKNKVNINIKNNIKGKKIYNVFKSMRARCYNKHCENYKHYGERGITICDEWLDKESGFINFYNWAINNGYQEGLSIDRIDVNGNYEPNNCRWATIEEQNNNKTNNRYIIYNDKNYTITQWSKIFNIPTSTMFYKIFKQNKSIEEIFKEQSNEN